MNAAEFLENVIFMDPNESKKANIGFKLFFFHARNDANAYSLWTKLLSDLEIKVVFLFRRNLFDAFVSNYRARQTNIWQLDHNDSEQDVDNKLDAYNRSINVPVSDCRSYFEGIVAGRAWLLDKFASHQKICLYYEDLIDDMQSSMQKAFNFLGEASISTVPGNKKLNRIPHDKGIINFSEIKEHFEYSIYRDFFIDSDALSGTQ